MLALIEKGLKRKDAYEIVQKNAMKAWQGSRGFQTLLKSDAAVTRALSRAELEGLFDYHYYTQHVDDIFQRLGLTKSQWQGVFPENPA
jgi:adenylosuccinate lyase